MTTHALWSIEAPWEEARLRVFEPTEAEVLAAAPLLADFYNDAYNAAMLTNTHALTIEEVVETYQSFRAAGDRPFLLDQDDTLIGDGDFRNIRGSEAEFAIMVGRRAQQSRGIGTRFAAMMHLAAVRVLGIDRFYGALVPANVPSRRMLEKLGYQIDQSEHALAFAAGEDEMVMSVDRTCLETVHAELMKQMVITKREVERS